MSYYGQVAPIKHAELTKDGYELSVDVQKVHTFLACRGCNTKMIEGEPMLSIHIKGDYKLNWRRNYCGGCAAKQVAGMITNLQEMAVAMQGEVDKLGGDGYYVARRMAGDTLKDRKAMKVVLDELTKTKPTL